MLTRKNSAESATTFCVAQIISAMESVFQWGCDHVTIVDVLTEDSGGNPGTPEEWAAIELDVKRAFLENRIRGKWCAVEFRRLTIQSLETAVASLRDSTYLIVASYPAQNVSRVQTMTRKSRNVIQCSGPAASSAMSRGCTSEDRSQSRSQSPSSQLLELDGAVGTYMGGVLDGKADGLGAWTAEGSSYAGEWKDDMKHGRGSFTWTNGEVYDGKWKDDVKHGHGSIKYANGSAYIGEWQDDMKHGRGSLTSANGEVYDGEWKDGVKHGHGSIKYANGNTYVGEWQDDKMHGRGTCTWASGNVYSGAYKANKMHGRGTFKWFDGDRYDGQYKEDTRDGSGTLKWADGRICSGTWEMNALKCKA